MLSAREALQRLKEGNRRFTSNARNSEGYLNPGRLAELSTNQEPFAIILGCSDSRVPAEIVFDQGLGDLFVIRVAGNIVAPSQVGSVEFAAERFGTRLVVVLGHSRCGAILATLEELRRPRETDLKRDMNALVDQAVRLNIRASANHLRHGSEVLEQLIQDNDLLVVGAEYSLETGEVEFFDGLPEGDPGDEDDVAKTDGHLAKPRLERVSRA
jgi:carbonic anhydrase